VPRENVLQFKWLVVWWWGIGLWGLEGKGAYFADTHFVITETMPSAET
jgi:hypothetical protein